ncbi:MAG TPA: hypothetical protein PLT86_09990, partial [Candidatus Latescibacteria bacterium]|nr:hypothetical protein [Candidatus Latescibacterota bacterium]
EEGGLRAGNRMDRSPFFCSLTPAPAAREPVEVPGAQQSSQAGRRDAWSVISIHRTGAERRFAPVPRRFATR